MYIKSIIFALFSLLANEGKESSRIKISAPWFTNTSMDDLKIVRKSGEDVAEVPGMNGIGIIPGKPYDLKGIKVPEQNGYVSFWISPQWDGNDQNTHRLLNLGTTENGFFLEKSGNGMLRFVMNGPLKTTSVRYDVSHWKKGDWHQIILHWFTRDNLPAGINIYSDQILPGRGGPEPIDGVIATEGYFFNHESLNNTILELGSTTSKAVFDEFFVAELPEPSKDFDISKFVYHDYYQTAPFQKMRIDPYPAKVKSDLRVLAGFQKQFGLEGFIKENKEYKQLTDFTIRYNQWEGRDAKPLIKWAVSKPEIALVDETGMVTGIKPGKCKLIAKFRGMVAIYDLEVIDIMRPDLSIGHVTRYPRYSRETSKKNPFLGDTITWVVNIHNFGFKPVTAGIPVTLRVTPDSNGNFILDKEDGDAVEYLKTQTLVALDPFESTVVEFKQIWSDEPLWLEFSVNDSDKEKEICMPNNQRIRLNTARRNALGLDEGFSLKSHSDKIINLVGSFGYVDYAWACIERLNGMLREAVYPTTSPNGIEDFHSLEMTYEGKNKEKGSTFKKEQIYWDGGYPSVGTKVMNINSGMMHELGHNILKLPDLYNYPVKPTSSLIRMDNDKLDDFRFTKQESVNPLSPSACGPYYDSFMNNCHMYLHPANAGKIHHFRGYYGDRFWGAQSRLLPTRESGLQLFDVNDEPLKNAHISVYHAFSVFKDWRTWFIGKPKFIGHTDNQGIYIFDKKTHPEWDDPATDVVERSIPIWNPFGTARENDLYADVPFTPSVVRIEGLLLVKVVSNDETEYHFVTDFDYQTEFYKGNSIAANVPINTNLHSTQLISPPVDRVKGLEGKLEQEIRHKKELNLIPVAITNIDSISVKPGERFFIDASESFDPENKKLDFVWESSLFLQNALDCQPMVSGIIPKARTRDFEVSLWVSDGTRLSEKKIIKVHVIN